MEIKTKAVKLFCAIVETGTLLAAANKLALSASAASREISQLESRLGVKLFYRSSKTLELTPEGEDFYRTALESTRAWQHIEQWPDRYKNRKKILRIAVLARHCSDVILPAVASVLKRHKATLSVCLDIHTSRDIYYSKHSHPFDIGFGTLLTEHDDLTKVPLAHLPLQLVVSRDHPLARKSKVSLEELERENFIMLSHDIPEAELERSILPHLNPDQIAAEVSTTQAALRLVKQNVGVHITDQLAVHALSKDCVVLDIESTRTIPFYVFWPTINNEDSTEKNELIAEIVTSIASHGYKLTGAAKEYLRENRVK